MQKSAQNKTHSETETTYFVIFSGCEVLFKKTNQTNKQNPKKQVRKFRLQVLYKEAIKLQ